MQNLYACFARDYRDAMVAEIILNSRRLLKNAGIDSAQLDAELLLAFTLGKSREWILAHHEINLTTAQKNKFTKLINRRAKHEPLAYVVSKKEFYGREFLVSRDVLIPRPETEILVDEALSSALQKVRDRELSGGEKFNKKLSIIDVGTGSGCIAITLAKELERSEIKNINIFAIDSSRAALTVAQKNAKKHLARLHFLHGNLLVSTTSTVPWFEPWDCGDLIIVANLPYLTPREWRALPPNIGKYEPREALVGGADGLKYFSGLLRQIKQRVSRLVPPPTRRRRMEGVIPIICFFEINPWQKKPLTKIIKKLFPSARIEFIKDLGKSIRICKIKL